MPSANAVHRIAQSRLAYPGQDIPYLDEAEYDVGLTLPFDRALFDVACHTPLGPPDLDEELYFHEHQTAMMGYESESGHFMSEPLEVDRGVAVLEESVQLCVPDVISQI